MQTCGNHPSFAMQEWKYDALQREVPGVESHWVDTQTHAFCVSERQSGALGGWAEGPLQGAAVGIACAGAAIAWLELRQS